jgi:hypothetical protein
MIMTFFERFRDKSLSRASELLEVEHDDVKNRSIAFIYDELKAHVDTSFKITPNVLSDIEFDTSVFDTLNNCHLSGGKHVSKLIYTNPVYNIKTLQQRRQLLETLEKHMSGETLKNIQRLQHVLSSNEHHLSWYFEEKEEELEHLYDMVFFRLRGLRPLNQSGAALSCYNMYRIFFSPIFGILAPIIYFIIPYLVVLYKLKIKLPFTLYMRTMFWTIFNSEDSFLGSGKKIKYIRIASYLFSAVFYFQGIFNSIDLSRTVNKISRLLITHLHGMVQYIKASHELINVLGLYNYELISSFFDTCKLTSREQDKLFVESIDSAPYNVFSNFGKHLKTFRHLDKQCVKSLMLKSYILDGLLGALTYKKRHNYCFANYVDPIESQERTPCIEMNGMVHPCIVESKSVKNDVTFGKLSPSCNAIITSPNSSGKSVLIKGIVINVLMAQTMTIVAATSAHLTPFAYINTQINVPDTTGYESLFEAEMHRCKANLDILSELNDRGVQSLIVMDEIFNSTNPVEAVAGAYAVCKRMASYTSNILIFTTHFNYLTKLAHEKACRFGNYRMQTIVKGSDITFTYRFEKGVNKHLLALELLRKSGFEDSILADAIELKRKLTTKQNIAK